MSDPNPPAPVNASPTLPPEGKRPISPGFSIDHMDRTIDPTVDFYQYATGSWIRNNPVPADKSRWGSFAELTELNYERLRDILEESARAVGPDRSMVQRLVGAFYASAMDVSRIEALAVEPLQEDLRRIENVRDLRGLFELVAQFHRRSIGGLFDSFVYPDKRNSTVYAFYLVQGGLSLPDREYYLAPEFAATLAAYRRHLGRMFGLLGESEAGAAASADRVVTVETALAQAGRSRTELRDEEKNYHRRTFEELVGAFPGTPWAEYLSARELARPPYVILGQPEFFEFLDRTVRERPIEEWKVYLRWHLLHASAPFLGSAFEQEDFEFFHRTLKGQEQPEPRWLRVSAVLDGDLGEAVGELYVQRHFPPEARARMVELVGDLTEVFRERLTKLDWMSEATRRKALTKFDRFAAKIGHPEKFRDYSSIRIDPNDYLGNHWRAAEFEDHRQVVRVGGPIDRTEWGMTPPQVNAYFDPTKNEIVFPAGILQPPFFDPRMDDAVNLGGIGAVIGHEITHGYDDQGRKYDAEGNLANWWGPEDLKEFDARAAKVVAEYDSYEPLPSVHVNGQLTLGENIADIGGVSIAFEALQRRLARDPGARRPIDGLTPEQRFFVAWAQIWRQTIQEPELRRRLTVDPHSQGKYRVMAPATNLPAFADAFGISERSPLWRAGDRRITIW